MHGAGKFSELSMPHLEGIDFGALGRGISGMATGFAFGSQAAPAASQSTVAATEFIKSTPFDHNINDGFSHGLTTDLSGSSRGMGGILGS